MTVKEALSELLDSVDIAEHEEAIATITESINADVDTGYKAKYEELYKKYKERFLDMLDDEKEDENVEIEEEEERVTFEDLTFDGETE
jgi:hypothetical protein